MLHEVTGGDPGLEGSGLYAIVDPQPHPRTCSTQEKETSQHYCQHTASTAALLFGVGLAKDYKRKVD